MKTRMLRIARAGFTGFAVSAFLLTGGGVGFRAYRQHVSAHALAIQSPNGIQEGMYVKIGGIDQWIEIRGEDRSNPVILFVHGGPGGSTIPISSAWRQWEKYFTIVQWDQRGAGRTFRMTGEAIAPTMTLAQMTQDGVEVAEFLRAHLHKDRIVLIGHSWGSFLGVHIVRQRPDLFHAFVGTGQLVGKQTFEKQFELTVTHLKALAQAAHNTQALTELDSVVASSDYGVDKPCDTISFQVSRLRAHECDIVQKWANALSLPSIMAFSTVSPIPPLFMPDFSLLDWYYWRRGASFSVTQLSRRDGPMTERDLSALGMDFSIPVFFFEGTEDFTTPVEPAYAYFQQIKAPQKEFVLFNGADHFIPFDRPNEFLTQLMEHIRPLTLAAEGRVNRASDPPQPR